MAASRNGTSGNGSGPRIGVRKTYKLYIGGAFPRSESGRSYLVSAADGTPLANAVRASRKDLRDSVRAARNAFPGWAFRAARTASRTSLREASATFAPSASYVRPDSERGNFPPT